MPNLSPIVEAAERAVGEKIPILWEGKLAQVVKGGIEHNRWLKGLNPFEKVEVPSSLGAGGGAAAPSPAVPTPAPPARPLPQPELPPLTPATPPETPAVGRPDNIWRAIMEPAIPTAENRGTAESPQILADAWAKGQPVRTIGSGALRNEEIDPRIDEIVSRTYDNTKSIPDRIRDVKSFVGGLFSAAPNMPRDIKAIMLEGRSARDASDTIAGLDIAEQLRPITDKKWGPQAEELAPKRFATVGKHLLISDTIAQMERDGVENLHGMHIDEWKKANEQLLEQINKHGGMREAADNVRNGLDELFKMMVDDGLIDEDRYLDKYAMRKRINSIIGGLASAQGLEEGALRTRLLSQTKSREAIGDTVNESNVMHLLVSARAEYYKLKADRDLAKRIFSDPTLEFGRNFKAGDTLPRGLVAYNPGPGEFGYIPSEHDGAINSVMNMIDPEGKLKGPNYVIPEALANQLKRYNPSKQGLDTTMWQNASRNIAKYLTVYNPANTTLNRFSDAMLAMTGLPGEKADPIGFMRFYLGARKAAQAYVRGNEYWMKINGQDINVTDLIAREGVGDATLASNLNDQKFLPELGKYLPESEKKTGLGNRMQRWRQEVELTPRIAAGLAALEKVGDPKEFGRVGRNITLNFESGAPAAANVPIVRFISPFITFTGLAMNRTVKLLGTEGSRGRTIAGMIAIPAAADVWNTQNKDYRDVENAIKESDRDQLHIIVPDFRDPSKPLRDRYGKPVIWRVRYFVPEEMMKMAGLGNLVPRISRKLEDNVPPIQIAQQIIGEAGVRGAKNAAETLTTTPNIVSEVTKDTTPGGRKISLPEKVARFIPVLKPIMEGATSFESEEGSLQDKIFAAAKTAAARATGTTFITPDTQFGATRDAQIDEARVAMGNAQRAYKYAVEHGPSSDIEPLMREFFAARERYIALAQASISPEGVSTAQSATPMIPQSTYEQHRNIVGRTSQQYVNEGQQLAQPTTPSSGYSPAMQQWLDSQR